VADEPSARTLAIAHDAFAQLRLADYAPADVIVQLDNWEYLDRRWLGEAWDFTEWLRPESDPDRLRSIALDLQALPGSVATAVLTTIQLPLRPGMSIEEITGILGEPAGAVSFLSDRMS
jgi:hypothetical protein